MNNEEIEKTAIKMLRDNLDIKLISQVTGISTEELIKLKYKTLIVYSEND